MIATLILGIVIITGIVFIIKEIRSGNDSYFIGIPMVFIGVLGLITALGFGYSKQINKTTEIERTLIINSFMECPCIDHFNDIEKYNNAINRGNNIFCRFKVEDRKEYLITFEDVEDVFEDD